MNQEIKIQWTGKLRSGEFAQGAEYLRQGDAYCCLGVLCHLAGEAGIIEPAPADGYYEEDYYDDDDNLTSGEFIPAADGQWDYGQPDTEETLPRRVQEWSGLAGLGVNGSNPIVHVPGRIFPRLTERARLQLAREIDGPSTITLAQLNDAGVPFGVIADIIDANEL